MQIDLNCDLGESFGDWAKGMDREVMAHITSANIACGFHAGDPQVMDETVSIAVNHGVQIGAHPGYPDLMGFGRRAMACTPAEVRAYVLYQIGALEAFARVHGARLTHVKAHGALYNAAVEREEIAGALMEAVRDHGAGLILVVMAGRGMEVAGRLSDELGVKLVAEAFPDRAYTPQGTLASRRLPGAVIHDPEAVASRAVKMAVEGEVETIDGSVLELHPQTLCVHGDNPAALEAVRAVRSRLESHGVRVAPFGG